MLRKLLNLFKKKKQPKLTLDVRSPFYQWSVNELTNHHEIRWNDLLEYGVITEVKGTAVNMYYMSSPKSWKGLYGREALVKVCLRERKIIEYIELSMN